MADLQGLLNALEVFGQAPDKTALEQANTWLQDFQHSPEAWSTCNVLLLSPDAPPAAKLFASQTFRTKVTYDLNQVDPVNVPALRDTLLTALKTYQGGPRTIITQLCLAIAGLALQFTGWENPVQTLIDSFGRDPVAVPTLLQFLTVLPEELTSNTRIPVTDEEYRARSAQLLTDNSQKVLELLSMYNQATGVTNAVQTQILTCLRSWLIAGEIVASDFAATPLFGFSFDALNTDELFDSAVDILCELIHETQEIDDNMQVIELIVPRLIALKPRLSDHHEDPEKIRGYARIFTEAGETYRMLLLQHTETFFPIVEAIGVCSAYPDLDVVPITFPFWMRLAQVIGKKPSVSPLFLDAYRSLMAVIINHLHFPKDESTLAGQEAEKFRSFRHVMGDTLKDCCLVLRPDACLLATYQMIVTGLSLGPSVTWQEVEAPLFAMRSMGAEVDVNDKNAVPKVLSIIPSLPTHPRVRYAALLVISRYTEWINLHPEYISAQLQYISAGFEVPDSDVTAAAGQALKYLCQDCKEHLADFLPTLHTFLTTTGTKLIQDDRREVYEAIGHVISGMPIQQAADSLRTFALDLLSRIHSIATSSSPATKPELQDAANCLENLEVMMHVVQSFGEELPPACQNTSLEMWPVFDQFFLKYSTDYGLVERATRVIRHGINLFGDAALSIAPLVVARMTQGFEEAGFSSYLWIGTKIIGQFGANKNPELRVALSDMFERSTGKLVALLQLKPPGELPDVIEDYIQLLLRLLDFTPDILFQSSSFPLAFRASMAALTLVHTDVVFAALEFFRVIVTHDSLSTAQASAESRVFSASIKTVVEKEGFDFVGYLLIGLVGDFPEDSVSAVVSIFRSLSAFWSSQMLVWLPAVLQQLPAAASPAEAKTRFFADASQAINSMQYDKVKYAVLALHRASRKARDRRRGLDR